MPGSVSSAFELRVSSSAGAASGREAESGVRSLSFGASIVQSSASGSGSWKSSSATSTVVSLAVSEADSASVVETNSESERNGSRVVISSFEGVQQRAFWVSHSGTAEGVVPIPGPWQEAIQQLVRSTMGPS